MKSMNKILLVGFIFLNQLAGTAQQSFSLSAAKEYALENNITIKNADRDIEIAKQQIVEVRGMGLPQVDFNANFNHFINLPVQVVDASFFNPNAPDGQTISFEAGTKYSSTGTLQVGQLLFNGSYIIGLQAANFVKKLQETSSSLTKEETVFNVIQAYNLVAVAQENIQFVDSMVIITSELIDQQQNYLDLGLITQEDIDQLSYSLLTAKDAQLSADLQLKNSLNMLKLAMGYPIDQDITIQETPEQLLKMNAISAGNSIQNNLSFELIDRQIKLSEYNLKNNQFANLPSLNGFFQHTYNAYRNEFNFFDNEKWFPQTLWGVQLNVPIFSGLTRHAKVQQAKVRLLKDQDSKVQLEESLKFQELQAKNNLLAAQSKHDLQQQNIELARSLYNNSIASKEVGKGNALVVTQKYNQLMLAQAQYVGSLVELFQAKLSLDKLYNNILPKQH